MIDRTKLENPWFWFAGATVVILFATTAFWAREQSLMDRCVGFKGAAHQKCIGVVKPPPTKEELAAEEEARNARADDTACTLMSRFFSSPEDCLIVARKQRLEKSALRRSTPNDPTHRFHFCRHAPRCRLTFG